jgi:hypothetical protein
VLQHGEPGARGAAAVLDAHDEARAQRAQAALGRLDDEGAVRARRVGRGAHVHLAPVQAHEALRVAPGHVQRGGGVQGEAAAVGQHGFAALAGGRGVVGRPALPGRVAPAQPGGGCGHAEHGQGAQHGAAAGVRGGAREHGHAQRGRHGAELARQALGLLPCGLVRGVRGAPALAGGEVGSDCVARVQAHQPARRRADDGGVERGRRRRAHSISVRHSSNPCAM